MTGDTLGVLFVCYGNICRSPLGEFIFKDMLVKSGLEGKVRVASCGTNVGWEGESVSSGSRQQLLKHGISCEGKTSKQLRTGDYYNYDYIIAMDRFNYEDILAMSLVPDTCTVKMMMDYACGGDVADPYYTHNYEKAYEDIELGCRGLLKEIEGRLKE